MRLEDTFKLFNENITDSENLLMLIKYSTDDIKSKTKIYKVKEPKKSRIVENFIDIYVRQRKLKAQVPTNPTSYANSLNLIKRLESRVYQSALEQAIVQMCTAYEEYIRRVCLKYFEDDKRRLHGSKSTLNDGEIIDVLEAGYNMHRALAEKVVSEWMYGSVEKWYEKIRTHLKIEFELDAVLKELFLIRNAIVHNERRGSPDLVRLDIEKYKLNVEFKLTLEQFYAGKDAIHQSAKYLQARFDEAYPVKGTDWYLDYIAARKSNA